MPGDGGERGLLAWIHGGDVKVKGAFDLGTGLPIKKLPSVSPMCTNPVDHPAILSNALAQKGIKHTIRIEAGAPTFGVDTDRFGLWSVIKSILGL